MKQIPNDTIPGYLGKCIREGEHQQQDFKFAINDSRKIAETLSAFANTDGGRLLVGVKDNGKIAGIRSDEEMYMIEGAGQIYCKPEVPMEFQTWEYNNKLVLEVWVPASPGRPHKAKTEDGFWKAFVRVDDANFLASPVHLSLWKQQDTPSEIPGEFSDDEKVLLRKISDSADEGITLNKLCRYSTLDREEVIHAVAHLVRWELVYIERKNDRFVLVAEGHRARG
ncbi:MAG: ATP-binding protein [Flavobacteriales bacterium]|nr:MAG: ATP-binding protein [Flavobacteriales bacterium]